MKNLALMAHITTEVDEYPLRRLANNAGVQHISLIGGVTLNKSGDYIVFLNGTCNISLYIFLNLIFCC